MAAKFAVIVVCAVNFIGAIAVVGLMVYDQIKYGKDPLHE